jgi:hypothetical protein
MLSPKAAHLLIQHLDAIDRAVTKRAVRKRPWLEPGITSLLCDLMDEDTQGDENLDYTIGQLNSDLAREDGLLTVRLSVETHEFHPNVERWVTQSDIGFILTFRDHLLPAESWSRAWLLQAKRIEPDSRNPVRYSEVSRVSAIDKQQEARMAVLDEAVGGDFVRHLLYCPRPDSLEDLTRLKLWRLRQANVNDQIFDYALGLELHSAASQPDSSLAAGLFVAGIDNLPPNLGKIHGEIFVSTIPLAWFIAAQFFDHRPTPDRRLSAAGKQRKDKARDEEWRNAILRGDAAAVDRVLRDIGTATDVALPFLPPHTLTVEVAVGAQFDSNRRSIRGQG